MTDIGHHEEKAPLEVGQTWMRTPWEDACIPVTITALWKGWVKYRFEGKRSENERDDAASEESFRVMFPYQRAATPPEVA